LLSLFWVPCQTVLTYRTPLSFSLVRSDSCVPRLPACRCTGFEVARPAPDLPASPALSTDSCWTGHRKRLENS
jgi:hypothetical protein